MEHISQRNIIYAQNEQYVSHSAVIILIMLMKHLVRRSAHSAFGT